jgi:hypothetical protein
MPGAPERAGENAAALALSWARRLDWRARRGGQAGVVGILSITMWLNWGSTYYLLTVLARPMAEDTGWPLTTLIAGLSFGLVIAGLASPAIGGVVERRGGRPVLGLGSVALGLGLAAIGIAQDLAGYFAAWAILGLGMAASLSDAAFATLGRIYGLQARGPISGLLLIGSIAMTAWWPVSAVLVEALGWRGTCFCYAALHLALGMPLHLLLLPAAAARGASTHVAAAPAAAGGVSGPSRSRRALLLSLLGTNLTLHVAIGSVIAVHLISLLQGLGVAFAAAVGLSSLIWLAQAAGRLAETVVGRHFHPVWEGMAASALVLGGIALLLVGEPAAIAVALVVFGVGNGIRGIVKGTLPLVLFGAEGYAALIGRLGLPTLIAQAAGPTFGAIALAVWGTEPTLIGLAGLAFVNLLLACALRAALPQGAPTRCTSPG